MPQYNYLTNLKVEWVAFYYFSTSSIEETIKEDMD
jgi:hypothetical protein